MAIEKLQTPPTVSQKLTLQDREHLNIMGVESVDSFSDNEIILITNMGKLTIKGENLHINHLNTETKEFLMDGRCSSFVYSRVNVKKTSFLERLFK